MKFTEFNLSDTLLAGLRDVQFNEPTPIQEKSIPIVTAGKDLIATAQTGTGKTGAFIIPIMERVLQSERKGVKALIVSPTRELASQIDEQIFAIGYHAGITSATVIGGSDFSVQAKALKAGVDIIVATPGRLIDQNKVVNIDFENLEYLVLDEADRMLDMGFLPDIKKIISWLPDKRQTLLFSATMPNEIQRLASTIMKDPESVDIERSKPSTLVEQRAYRLKSDQKIPLVKKIFKDLTWDSCIIFTSTKKGTDELQRLLKREGIKAESIHGDRSQDERNRALDNFRNGNVPVIVATDVLARGIDIKGVSIIINYDVPHNSDDYIHRIGRTGRYDKSGIAITFVTRRDNKKFESIQRIKGNTLNTIDVPGNFGEKSEFSWQNGFSSSGSGTQTQKRQKRSSSKESSDKKDTSSDTKRTTKRAKTRPGSDSNSGKGSEQKRGTNKENKQEAVQKKQSKEKEDKQKKQTQSRSRNDGRDKESGKSQEKSGSRGRQNNGSQKSSQENVTLPPIIEKAVERNKRARKPSKGVWGVIKSLIPKFTK
ncbi:DEAD/DEAH box helicase [Rhodohalobacter mucosus]|uniref:ATP-dependent helicase n=1 Tax=Rhodohalobacter mucosus TaxID=2079485 RepID=A0A316TUS6_9BACT|nr:DEAD/DEAH box helicase [Rhodohalobacter mucosus]PWN07029.1 ATP-dependent helicase [Rhodohalobacter mucosus]